jgi:tetratricopeptide (TPR) repeat protein
VEQYRNNPKPTPVVAEEMNVSYILEGSGHRDGNNVRLIVQLLDGQKDQHLWSKSYDADIAEIFTLQSEIAQLVASEIEAIITPEEKELIEKIPTANLTAYDLYQRGREEHERYWLDSDNKMALERAEDLYYKALDYDSSFALAYTGLAWVYWNKHYWEEFLTENFLDSVLILADIALSFDDQLADAHVIRGNYFSQHHNKEQALIEYDKAIEFNPNEWMAYFGKGSVYETDILVKAIDNTHKAILLHRGSFLPMLLRSNGFNYAWAGFKEKAFACESEALALDGDSAWHYGRLASYEDVFGNFEEAIKYAEKSLAIDSTNWWMIYLIGLNYCYLDRNEEYLEYLKKFEKRSNTLEKSDFFYPFRIGHAYWVNGFKKEAEIYFNRGLELYNEALKIGIPPSLDIVPYYYVAAINSFLENRDKAYEYLGLINQSSFPHLWLIKDLNNDPLFDNIRNEPEFHQIVSDVEAKYQAEHERVRQWLEENEML